MGPTGLKKLNEAEALRNFLAFLFKGRLLWTVMLVISLTATELSEMVFTFYKMKSMGLVVSVSFFLDRWMVNKWQICQQSRVS